MSAVDNERPPYVAFEVRPMEDRTASLASGHYMTKDVIFAVVTRPGSRDSSDFEAETWLKNLKTKAETGQIPGNWYDAFLSKFEAFKRNEELPENGTPVKGWQVISPSVQQSLLQVGFRTVEELAAAPDPEIQRIGMGAITLREKARTWLAEAKTVGVSVEKIADLSQKVADLTALTERLLEENKVLRAAKADQPAGQRPVLAKA